jgi:tetratricopeptide (TPR) repeat protein
MESADLVGAIAGLAWTWTPAGVDRLLSRMPATRYDQTREKMTYRTPDGRAITVRLAGPGVVESIALVLARGRDPDDLDEGEWSDEVDDFDRRFRELARAVEARLGAPSHYGPPRRGRTWDSWASLTAIWPRPTAWVSVQERQDDTDAPIELCVVWTPPGQPAADFTPKPIPPDRQPQAPSPSDPRYGQIEAWLEREANRAVEIAKEGRVDEGIEILEGVLRSVPFWGESWMNLGILVGIRGQHARAMDCFDRALAEAPELLKSVTQNRVQAHVDCRCLPQVKEQLLRLFDAGQASAEHCYELANLLRHVGLDAACRKVLARFVETATEKAWADEVEGARRWLRTAPPGAAGS